MNITDKKELSISLFEAKTFRLGTFYTKSGTVLDTYFDLVAPALSLPSLLNKICDYASKLCRNEKLVFQAVCGTSYGGIPFGVILASKLQKSLFTRIKEVSYHPTQHRIEGNVIRDDNCLVVEEVVASGKSVLEVIKDIEDVCMTVTDVVTVIDLEQGGAENLKKLGYRFHSLLKMSELVNNLYDEKCLTADSRDNILKGFSSKFALNGDYIINTNLGIKKTMRYEERVEFCKSKVAKKLFRLMSEKQSNLCIDFISKDISTLLKAADLIGPFICIFTLHLDAFNYLEKIELENKLRKIADKHNFLIMDDRKFSENDDTLIREYSRKIFKVADLLSVHAISGEDILNSFKSIINEFPGKGIIVVTNPNISDALVGSSYEKKVISLTTDKFEEATGFICQNSDIPLGYVHMMSDILSTNAVAKSTNLSYFTSEAIVNNICADVIILSYDDVATVEQFVKKERLRLWNAYVNRIDSNVNGFNSIE